MSYLENFKYEIHGQHERPKLVFLHGLMGSGANWRKIVPAFSADHCVLTFDQRGHGWSFKPKMGYSPEDYSLDLKLILDELKWSKVRLVGHSMGGRNALHFAQKYPQLLQALVIEDIGPEGNKKAMQKTLDLIEMVPVPFASKNAAKEYLTGPFVEKLGGGEKAMTLGQYFYTNIEARSDGTADWRFSKVAVIDSLMKGHFQPRWDAVRDLKIPTLFIRGDRSEDFPKEEFDRTLQINPQVQGVEIANSGHWVHFDQPEAFISALKNFFSQL